MPIPAYRAAATVAGSATPLPDPWPSLRRDYNVRFRRSQLHMIAGQPAAGKSFFAQVTAHKIGARTLYVSADGDQATMLVREAAICTGHTIADVEHVQEQGRFRDVYQPVLAESTISYYFEPAPTMLDIWRELEAYVEIFGVYPEVIVIDNLMNLAEDGGGDNEWSVLKKAMKDLHGLCRETDSSIWVLHHVTEAVGEPGEAPPRKAIQGKVSQLPELILTVGNTGDRMPVAVVKNRQGASDAGAKAPVWFDIDGSRMQIAESRVGGFWDGVRG